MKILIIHNRYVYPGGEDQVVTAEKRMLEKFGHEVILHEQSNSEIGNLTLPQKLSFILKDAYWSRHSYQTISRLIKEEKPDIAHFHNTFFLVTPSAYDACYDAKIPIVQTLHNYRFLCPIGIFYRQGRICEDCLQKGKISAIINRCWRDSHLSSLVLTRIIKNIERKKVLSEKINHFIALTPFSRQKFIDSGFNGEKITIKPNFIDFELRPSREEGKYGLFVGALRDYKGITALVNAWKILKKDFPLKIIGNGPLYHELKKQCYGTHIELLGAKPLEETLELIKRSLFVVVPSECYENFPRVIIEAFACRVPVVATDHGALKDLITHGKTGLLFEWGSVNDLAAKIHSLIRTPSLAKELGMNARKQYEEHYTVEKNYEILMDIYNHALSSNRRRHEVNA